MKKRIFISLCAAAFLLGIQSAFARVGGLPDFTGLVEQTAPAVVNIQVTQYGDRAHREGGGAENPHNQEDIPEFFRRFFDVPGNPGYGQPDRRGAGSGFIFETDGYIITNHHVVEGADQIIVRLPDRREYEAELVGSDPLSDVALLKIEAEGLPTLKFGHSDTLRPGEWVVAIGTPLIYSAETSSGTMSGYPAWHVETWTSPVSGWGRIWTVSSRASIMRQSM